MVFSGKQLDVHTKTSYSTLSRRVCIVAEWSVHCRRMYIVAECVLTPSSIATEKYALILHDKTSLLNSGARVS